MRDKHGLHLQTAQLKQNHTIISTKEEFDNMPFYDLKMISPCTLRRLPGAKEKGGAPLASNPCYSGVSMTAAILKTQEGLGMGF